jgi:Zn-dependent protease with chaperone function
VLGPADRESFFATQARHRRATWRLTLTCALAAVIAGVPLSIALTPLLYAVVVLLTWVMDMLLPIPQAIWDAYAWVGNRLPETIEALDDPATPHVEESDLSRVPPQQLVMTAIVWLMPGILAMLLIWQLLRRLFQHGGVGGVLLALGAREPNLRDIEERQLVNVVQELAIAAGIPAPQVRLIDAPVSNAAVVGSSRRDATIIVARPLLEDLDRDETQGALGHLVASIGNGDLRGARSIIAIFETFGLVTLVMTAPVSRVARRKLRRVARYFFSRHTAEQRDEEARAVAGLLARDAFDHDGSEFRFLEEQVPTQRRGPSLVLLLYIPAALMVIVIGSAILGLPGEVRSLLILGVLGAAVMLIWYQWESARASFVWGAKFARVLVQMPYYLAVMLPQVLLMLVIPFILEPMIALLWRTRRYLADASAVQLTRNPNGVAGGLAALVARGGVIPAGHWAAPLFIVGPETVNARLIAAQRQRMQARMGTELERERADGRRGIMAEMRAFRAAGSKEAMVLVMEAQQQNAELPPGPFAFGGGSAPVLSFHPPVDRRLARLRRMGATIGDITTRRGLRQKISGMYVGTLGAIATVLFFLFLLIGAALLIAAIAILLVLSLFFCSILMVAVYALVLLLMP